MPKGNPARRRSNARSILSITHWRRFATHRIIYLGIAGIFGLGIIAYFGGSPGAGGGPMSAAGDGADAPIATVNGVPITRAEYERVWQMARRQRPSGSEAEAASLQGMILGSLIDNAILQAAARRQRSRVSDADVDRAIAEIRKERAGAQTKPLSDSDLLALTGSASMGELRDRMREQLVPRVLGQALAGTAKLSETDLQNSYDEIKVRHILVAVSTSPRPAEHSLPDEQARRKAEQILKEIRAGGNFAKLADEYTDDPSNAPKRYDPKLKKTVPAGPAKGGDLGWYRRGGGFDKAFEEAAFALKPGEVSGVVKTPFGYHIIKVDAVRRNLPKDFAQSKAKLLDDFRNQKASEALQQLLEKERKTAKIVWDDPSMEWRYEYARANPMGMGMMIGGAAPDAQDALLARTRTYADAHPADGAASLVLGQMLYQKYIMAGLSLPGATKQPPADRSKLRDEVIATYENALKDTEDTTTRMTLARLYQEAGNKDKALEHYEMVQRLLSWDDTPESKYTRQQLQQAFKELGKPKLAAQEAKKVAEISERERQEAKERAAQEAKERAEARARDEAARQQRKANTPGDAAKPTGDQGSLLTPPTSAPTPPGP
ncbi:MAG: peptidylprolyl isomerase [Chthonomonadales bacterium]|nr:peptidylprolyl isomerase [Chthonomonadales bacterium]